MGINTNIPSGISDIKSYGAGVGIVALLMATVLGILVLLGLTSGDELIVSMLLKAAGIVGLIFSLCVGIFAARRVVGIINYEQRTSSELRYNVGFFVLLLVFGILLSILSGSPAGLLMSLIGFLFLLEGILRPRVTGKSITPPSGLIKGLLVFGCFLGGLMAAGIVAVFAYFVLWSHWCNVSNSKCM